MRFLCIFLLGYTSLAGQSLSNLRTATINATSDHTIVDSLTIIPSSLNIYTNENERIISVLNPSCIAINNATVTLDTSCISNLNYPIQVQYRVMPYDISKPSSLIDSSQVEVKDKVIYIGYDYSPSKRKDLNKLIRNDQLAYDGNFTRGFSVGNSQSLVLNSNFNLQLNGDLGDDLKVQAAISDDNLPIQAEGNTQLLQEFDKVFIRVNKDQTSIVAGDYDLPSPDSYFMRYFKKLKGLQVSNLTELGPYEVSSTGNFAISRGKFARNLLPTREGNQGPYKLFGNEGERILKVLSGTEKVYLDGRLIKRGLDYDYIIFYDRSEILFTTNLLITKDSRLIVEFEYADQNYLRSQYAVGTSITTDKLEVNFNFYNEQDSKTTTGDIDLAPVDLQTLMLAGDDPTRTFRTGVSPVMNDLSQEQNYYNWQDEPSIQDSILVFTPNPTAASYIVSFSEVGFQQGSYDIDQEIAANGRAYKWVGQNMGSFEPIIRLIPPEKKQIMSVNATTEILKNFMVKGEVALSNMDRNRFSDLDQNDNTGFATKLQLTHELPLGTNEKFALLTRADYEFTQNHFTALNPFRSAEFSRDWSVNTIERVNENIFNFGVGLKENNGNEIAYSLSTYNRKGLYNGANHKVDILYEISGFKVTSNSRLLLAEEAIENISFLRPNLRIEKTFHKLKNWTVGYYFEKEENQTSERTTRELNPISFDYIINKYYIKNTDNESFNFGVSYNNRKDKLPLGTELLQSSTAQEVELFGKWYPSASSQLDWNFTVRTLDIDNPDLIQQSDKRSYLGRIDYKFDALNNGIKSTTSYLISSGQEAKTEFEYVRVEKGQGQYIWIDDGDGVEEVFEFQVSPVQDTANFVRVNIINNDFIRTLTNSVNQNLRIDLDNILSNRSNDSRFKEILSRFSSISSYRVSQKTEDNDAGDNFVRPFSFSISDTSLVSYSLLVNNTLFFNRGNPVYDIQLGNRRNRNKQVFVTGFEANGLQEYFTRLRLNVKRNIDFIMNINIGDNILDSENFDQTDYQIAFYNIKPELTYRPSQDLRFITSYAYSDKENKVGVFGETAESHDFSLKTSWRQSNTSSLDVNLSFVRVNYSGSENNNIELVILEGLKDGQNFLWNVNYSRKLSKYIEMLISYDGRKTGRSKTIHTGRAQIRANF